MEKEYLLLWDNNNTNATLDSPTVRGSHKGSERAVDKFTLDELNAELLRQFKNSHVNQFLVCDLHRTVVYKIYQNPFDLDEQFSPEEQESGDIAGRLKLFLSKDELDGILVEYVKNLYGASSKNIIVNSSGAQITLVQSKELIEKIKTKLNGPEI